MSHDPGAPTPHLHDLEAHVQAIEEDLEYYRAKRLEPRIFYLARRGIVTLYDLARAAAGEDIGPVGAATDVASRVRALQDALDAYVRGIGVVTSDRVKVDAVIEDTRRERGDYDAFFRIAKKHREGTLAERVGELERDSAEYTRLLRAFARALVDRGLLDAGALEREAEPAEPGTWSGARIVARAWVDGEFKARLIARGREAVRELGIPPGRLGKLGVVENSETVHNVVVCTLCSCYPHDLLGDTPWWYKHDSYKTRIVRDPRATLREMFGLVVSPGREIRVHDSTSDVRYMVLPRRPPGTEGWSEERLARLVTRDSLIGAGEALAP